MIAGIIIGCLFVVFSYKNKGLKGLEGGKMCLFLEKWKYTFALSFTTWRLCVFSLWCKIFAESVKNTEYFY